MISFEASMERLAGLSCGPLRTEKVFLDDALGRILAADIIAEADYPLYPMASMDGYAVLHSDLAQGSITIAGENPAGNTETAVVTQGHCIKTFTGAVMPEGADTLIPIENVTVEGDRIRIDQEVPQGFSVRPVAESYHQGEVLIQQGTTIGFAEIGVLAGLNRVMIPVAVRPKVAVLATGSEILDLGETQTSASQIRSSNNYTIAALAKMAGAEVLQLGTTKDDKASITAAFENALSLSDIVITTGGVSVGDYDFVKDIIPALGAKVVYQGVKIKPGQHVMVAQLQRKFIIALPGFAYSSTVTAILYAIPLIHKFTGRHGGLRIVDAVLQEPFKKRSKKSEFTACNVRLEAGRYMVNFEGKRTGSSAILNNMLGNTALMMSDETVGHFDVGATVKVILLDRF